METHEIADKEETAERAIDVVAILIEGFDALAAAGSVSIDDAKSPVFLKAYGWWAANHPQRSGSGDPPQGRAASRICPDRADRPSGHTGAPVARGHRR